MRAEAFARPMHSIGLKNLLLSGVVEIVAAAPMIYEAAVLSLRPHECVYVGLGQPEGQIYKSTHRGAALFTFFGRDCD